MFEASDWGFQTENTSEKKIRCRLFLAPEAHFHSPSVAIHFLFPGEVCGRLRSQMPPSRHTYGHVRFASCINSFSHRVHKVATDSKIAHLHLAQSVDQHVRRLDVWKQEQPGAGDARGSEGSCVCHQGAWHLHLGSPSLPPEASLTPTYMHLTASNLSFYFMFCPSRKIMTPSIEKTLSSIYHLHCPHMCSKNFKN